MLAIFWIPLALKVCCHCKASVHVPIKPKMDIIIERVLTNVKSPLKIVGNIP